MSHRNTIKSLFQGNGVGETAKNMRVSKSTVLKHRRKFIEKVKEDGLMDAATQYEIGDIVEELLKIRTHIKEQNLSVEDCRRGADIWTLLTKLEVNPDELNVFLEALNNSALKKAVSADKLLEYSNELGRLSTEENKTYEEFVEELKIKRSLNEQLTQENKILAEEIQRNQEKLIQEMAESQTTLTNLNEFRALKSALTNKNVDISSLDKLCALLENLEHQGYDPQKVTEFYSDYGDLKTHLRELGEERARLQENIEEMADENQRLKEDIKENMDIELSIERLESKSLTPEMIVELTDIVTAIGHKRGLQPREALEAFKTMIDTGFDSSLGFNTLIDNLRSHSEALKRSIVDHKDELESLDTIIEARKQALKALQSISNSGISDKELVNWKTILEEINYDVAAFREELAQLKEMDKMLGEKRHEILEINTRLTSAKRLLELTEAQASQNTESILQVMQRLEDSVNAQSARIQENIAKIDEYFNEDETGFKARTKAMVEEAYNKTGELVEKAQAGWKGSLNELQTTIEKMDQQAKRILQGAYDAGKTIGKHDALEKSNRLLLGEELSGIDSTIASLMIASRLKEWFKTKKANEMVAQCDKIIEYLEKKQLGLRP